MIDYLQELENKINSELEKKFVERQYLNGYLDALNEIRCKLHFLVEKAESETESHD